MRGLPKAWGTPRAAAAVTPAVLVGGFVLAGLLPRSWMGKQKQASVAQENMS